MKKKNIYKRIITLLITCVLIAGTFYSCGEADEAKNATDGAFSTKAILESILEEYFDAVTAGDYDKLMKLLPPDIVCDDLRVGHISAEEYTAEVHEDIFNELKEEFIEAKEDFSSLYGDNLQIDYTVTKTETITAAGIDDMLKYYSNDGYSIHGEDVYEFYWEYAAEYYSPVFNLQGVQCIEFLSGNLKLSGDLGDYEESEFTACFIKHSDKWYFVGIDCGLSYYWMWL